MANAATVSEYLASVPANARKALREIRATIKKAAPGVTERISYGIPTFEVGGKYLLYMAGYKKHVSIYPVTAGMVAKCGRELAPYRSGAGTLRFDLDDELPLGLITKLAKVRLQEQRKKAVTKRSQSPRRSGKTSTTR